MRTVITISLNGTKENPYHKYGLKQNPFPQLGQAEFDEAEMVINELGGDPIPDERYIQKKLKGFSPEFVKLCCRKFQKGKYVTFRISF